MEISVVIPAYNEDHSLRETMERAVAALRSQFERFEIIVVNDASRDATGRIADELAVEHPEIRVLHNEKNLGAGASLMKGIHDARYALVTHNAVDYPFDLVDLEKMTPLLAEADIVVATRTERAGYTLYRRITSIANLALLHLLFPLRLRDYNFVQLYKREVLESVQVEARSTAFVTPEMMIRAYDQGFRIKEVCVEYHPRERGVATSGSFKVIRSSFKDMIRFWWKRLTKREPRPIRPVLAVHSGHSPDC